MKSRSGDLVLRRKRDVAFCRSGIARVTALRPLAQLVLCMCCCRAATSGEPTAVTLEKPSLTRPERDEWLKTKDFQARYEAIWNSYDAHVRETSQKIETEIKKLSEAAKGEGNLDAALLWETASKEFRDSGSLEALRARGHRMPDSLVAAFRGYDSDTQTLLSDYKALIRAMTQAGRLDIAFQLRLDSEDIAYIGPTHQALWDILRDKACEPPIHNDQHELWMFSGRKEKGDWRPKRESSEPKKPYRLGRAIVNPEGVEIGGYRVVGNSGIRIFLAGVEAEITDLSVRQCLGESELTGLMAVPGRDQERKVPVSICRPLKVTRATAAIALEEFRGQDTWLPNNPRPQTLLNDKDMDAAYSQMWTDYEHAVSRARQDLEEELVKLSRVAKERGSLDAALFWDWKGLNLRKVNGLGWRISSNTWKQWFDAEEYPEHLSDVVARCNDACEAARNAIRKDYKAIEESLTRAGRLEQALAVRGEASAIGARGDTTLTNRQLEVHVWDPVSGLPIHGGSYRLSAAGPGNEAIKSLAQQGEWRAMKTMGGEEAGCYTEKKGVIMVMIPRIGVICFTPLGSDENTLVLDGQMMRPDRKVALAGCG